MFALGRGKSTYRNCRQSISTCVLLVAVFVVGGVPVRTCESTQHEREVCMRPNRSVGWSLLGSWPAASALWWMFCGGVLVLRPTIERFVVSWIGSGCQVYDGGLVGVRKMFLNLLSVRCATIVVEKTFRHVGEHISR